MTSDNSSIFEPRQGGNPEFTEMQERRMETIRGLLAKAEASQFPEEAQAFFEKASELIAKFSIDEALLWSHADRTSREVPESTQLVVHAPYIPQKAVLVSRVAETQGCRAVRLSAGRGARTEIVSITGFPSDLRWVETLVTSLFVQLTSALLAESPRGLTASDSASWRRSFIIGFAEEVARRLELDRDNVTNNAGSSGAGGSAGGGDRGNTGPTDSHTGRHSQENVSAETSPANSTALVLAEREREVDREFRKSFPRIRQVWTSSGRSRSGQAAGRHAGREAQLGRRGLGGRHALGSGN